MFHLQDLPQVVPQKRQLELSVLQDCVELVGVVGGAHVQPGQGAVLKNKSPTRETIFRYVERKGKHLLVKTQLGERIFNAVHEGGEGKVRRPFETLIRVQPSL